MRYSKDIKINSKESMALVSGLKKFSIINIEDDNNPTIIASTDLSNVN